MEAQKESQFLAPDNGAKPEAANLWSWKSRRFRVAIILALALSIEGFMRSNINMAMVCMVNRTASGVPDKVKNLQLAPECTSGTINGNTSGKFLDPVILSNADVVLSKREQAYVLTSFYFGGLFMVIPGGYLCDRFGPKQIVFIGAVINVLGTMLSPEIVRHFGAWALIFVRILMGCGQVVLVPCMNVLVARWFPLREKSTAIAITTTGNQVSVVVALLLTAYLCQWTWLGGWPSAFYVYAIMGIFLLISWLYYIDDTPENPKYCPPKELELIQADGHMSKQKGEKVVTPWRKVTTSLSVWAIALSSFSQNFMNVGTIVYLPAYYENILGLKLSRNGIMSALPFVVQLFTKILFTWWADCLKSRNIMTLNGVTKLFNSLASFGAGICYILIAYCDCTTANWAIVLATVAVGLSSGFIPGYNTSVVCVAPRYTSSVASFSRFFAQVASVAAPYMIGLVVKDDTKEEWKMAFFIMAFILISTGFIFQFWGTASVEEWAKPRLSLEETEAQKPLETST
ncbi:unnamed protein product [Bursaphelenchus okinawaensis]|uniref:Major facilitator superfamily (MFS) profile domain-containing protein n=1 Tax=Bursaphelenchus okinawaensis TaxID=465554 RepID=A0A811KWZ9_9BILA|nr:unnamed protein product [Bursaphelenchus okinawaensis]CAG9113198.1 unnamed protein product [Bursaphelenchus okinawaensis]